MSKGKYFHELKLVKEGRALEWNFIPNIARKILIGSEQSEQDTFMVSQLKIWDS